MTVSSLIGREATPLMAVAPGKESLVGLGRNGLAEKLATLGVPERQHRMRASQLWSWIYVRGVTDFAVMTDIAKELRGQLSYLFEALTVAPEEEDPLGLE